MKPNIEGFPNYHVTKDGRVFNIQKRKEMKQFTQDGRYWKVRVSANDKAKSPFVHRLVALAYISNPSNKPQVNHIDSNKANNHVDNLEWCTSKENCSHSVAEGTFHKGERNGKSKITEDKARMIKTLLSLGYSVKDISAKTNVSKMTIYAIKDGRTWKHI